MGHRSEDPQHGRLAPVRSTGQSHCARADILGPPLVHAVHPTPLQLFIEKYQPSDLPDWSRVTFGKGFSVEQDHFFATNSIAKEFADLAAAWKAWAKSKLWSSTLPPAASNRTPPPPTHPLGRHAVPRTLGHRPQRRFMCDLNTYQK